MKVLLVLLFVFACNVESVPLNQLPAVDSYPCDTNVMISFDASKQLGNALYQKEIDFILNKVLEKWTRYNQLSVTSYGGDNAACDYFGNIHNKSDVEDFINKFGIDRFNGNQSNLCYAFQAILQCNPVNTHSILFLHDPPPRPYLNCWDIALQIRWQLASITFVIMNRTNIDVQALTELFPKAKFIDWDIANTDVPEKWEEYFWDAYGCEAKVSYPCTHEILFAYDATLDDADLQREENFLTQEVFPEWTIFNHLAVWSYGDTVTFNDFGYFFNVDQLRHFIAENAKSVSQPSLCSVFHKMVEKNVTNLHAIIFVSVFNKGQVNDECSSAINTVKPKLNSIAFVTIGANVVIDDLQAYFNGSKIIPWNAGESTPVNWGPAFTDVYNCSVVDQKEAYPCDATKKIIVSYDISTQLSQEAFDTQTNFILNKLFIKEWNHFEQLQLVAYDSHAAFSSDFGMLKNAEDIRDFVHDVGKSNTQSVSFQMAMTTILNENPAGAYLIIFVSRFTKQLDDSAPEIYTQVNELISEITVITLSEDVNTKYMETFFPDMRTIKWWGIETGDEDQPKTWRKIIWENGFGCDGLSPLIGTTLGTTESTRTTAPTKSHKSTDLPTTTAKSSHKSSKVSLIVGIAFPIATVLFWIILIWFCLYRRKQKQKRENLKNALRGGYVVKENNIYAQKVYDPWELLPENVLVNYADKLGCGAFGDVFSGHLIGDAAIKNIYPNVLLNKFHDCKIAIKSLPAYCDEVARNDFQQEINFMKSLKFHPNLVCMLGYVQDDASPLLVLELCSNGDLLQFIRKNKTQFANDGEKSAKILTSFAWQIASGLEYLASMELIHRDVAARNVLLDKGNICKISDFGLCRTSDNLYTSRGGKLPVRWMALESLKVYEYSTKSDVWSYGILLFELFSFGDAPYAGVENVLSFLEEGKRMDKPLFCSDQIYEIMLSCWRPDPAERPTFTEICRDFMEILESSNSQYNYVDAVNLEIEMTDSDSLGDLDSAENGENSNKEEIIVEIEQYGSDSSEEKEATVEIEKCDSDSSESSNKGDVTV